MDPDAPKGESPVEAVEWIQKADTGGTRSQVFRLSDGRYALVKFPQNPQGERVLVNEFVCCRIAETLRLPVNRAVAVAVDDRLLHEARQRGDCPADFGGCVACGLIRYQNAVSATPDGALFRETVNADELHGVVILEELVRRGDSRQLLAYPEQQPATISGRPTWRFAAFDYGFAFGGSPGWTIESLRQLPPPQLPIHDALGQPYTTAETQEGTIERLRVLAREDLDRIVAAIGLPGWGLSAEEGRTIAALVENRAQLLVRQYDDRYRPQLEVFNER